MKIGIDSFVAAVPDALTGENLGPADRLKLLLDEIEFADRIGLDVFGVGEHHRAEFLDIEAFPLFGLKLSDYDSLFANKLDLLLKIRENTQVHWTGPHRAPLTGQAVFPRPYQQRLPIWLGVGGTPASFVRAGTLGLPLLVAIIGGEPHRFRPIHDEEVGLIEGNESGFLLIR